MTLRAEYRGLIRAVTEPRKAPCTSCKGEPHYPWRLGDSEGWLCESCGSIWAQALKTLQHHNEHHHGDKP